MCISLRHTHGGLKFSQRYSSNLLNLKSTFTKEIKIWYAVTDTHRHNTCSFTQAFLFSRESTGGECYYTGTSITNNRESKLLVVVRVFRTTKMCKYQPIQTSHQVLKTPRHP